MGSKNMDDEIREYFQSRNEETFGSRLNIEVPNEASEQDVDETDESNDAVANEESTAATQTISPRKPIHYFVDFENFPARDLSNIGLMAGKDEIHFFYSNIDDKASFPLSILPGLTIRGDVIHLHRYEEKTKKDDQSVDKLLLMFLGADIGIHRDHICYVVVSDDKGYDHVMSSMQKSFHVNLKRQCPLGVDVDDKDEVNDATSSSVAMEEKEPIAQSDSSPTPEEIETKFQANLKVVRQLLIDKGNGCRFGQVKIASQEWRDSHPDSTSPKRWIFEGLKVVFGEENVKALYAEVKDQLCGVEVRSA